jgi:hypothetical protein
MSMRIVLLGLAVSVIAGSACAEEVSLCALARDPDAYDGQAVTVMATYDPALGDNGAFQDSECGDAVVLANLTAQPEPSPEFEAATAAGLPVLVTATGVFHNFLGETPTLQIDVETIAPE